MRDEAKEHLELISTIQDLGYSSLRYSIFSEEKPGEWEVVIEYNQVENLYFVFLALISPLLPPIIPPINFPVVPITAPVTPPAAFIVPPTTLPTPKSILFSS